MSAQATRPGWSLRQQLSRVLVVATLFPVLLFGTVLLMAQWQRDRQELLLRLDTNSRLSANAFDDFLEGELAGVRMLSDRIDGDVSLQGELQRLLRTYPAMLRAIATDAEGRVVAAASAGGRPTPLAEERVSDREWFRAPRANGKPLISDAYRARIYGNEALVAVSAPMLRAGAFDGVIQASIPIERIARLRSNSLRVRKLELLVLGRNGHVVHASEGLRHAQLDDAGETGRKLLAMATPADRPGKPHVMGGLLHDDGNAYAEPIKMRNGWVVVLVGAEERFLLQTTIARAGVLLILLAVTALGWWAARRRLDLLLRSSLGSLLNSLRGYALGGTMDPDSMDRMPQELQPLAAGIGELGGRMNAAYSELQRVLHEREAVIAERTASLQHAVSELDHISRTDALTGSLNYRGFLETGERLWHQARAATTPMSVLALDIDYFKRYNDLYGHAEGDGALRRFAGAVRSALLHSDDVLARPGGEEFIVFLPGTTAEQVRGVAERVVSRVRDAEIVHAASPEGRITVSVGIATMRDGDAEVEDMLRRADQALYRAKAEGRNRASE